MQNERLQEIKDGDWICHGTEEWTNQEDADTEAVILELITALEAAEQRIATMTESYNSIGKINAEQALEIRELKLELREIKNG